VLCLLAYVTCETGLAAAPKRVLLLHPSSGANLLSATASEGHLAKIKSRAGAHAASRCALEGCLFAWQGE
jgi:hypothetical protein